MSKKRGLGRNFNALLNNVADLNPQPVAIAQPALKQAPSDNAVSSSELSTSSTTMPTSTTTSQSPLSSEKSGLQVIPVDLIVRCSFQPRREFDENALQELAESIRTQGVLQPVLVRSVGANRYELIAGERRWRAAQLASLTAIPAIIRQMDDQQVAAVSLIENIQRENLNPLDEAYALDRLTREFNLTHQQVAEAVGKSRTAVTNLLRLMRLEKPVQSMLQNGDLEMGHARALLALEGQPQINSAQQVVAQKLSVRETEHLVRRLTSPLSKTMRVTKNNRDPNIQQLQLDLSNKLCAKVAIEHRAKGKGKLVIHYNNLDELDGILARFS
ncbi:MAG: ParB/RepB/Spo0J family partition protein [Gammaproteobacteria bacterium]